MYCDKYEQESKDCTSEMALSLTPELPGLTRKLAEDPHYCREDTLLLPFSSVGVVIQDQHNVYVFIRSLSSRGRGQGLLLHLQIQHERCNLTKTCIRGGTYTVMDDTQSMMAATARHMNLRAQAHLTDIDALVHRVLKLSASNEVI